jgi:hypothetical protein
MTMSGPNPDSELVCHYAYLEGGLLVLAMLVWPVLIPFVLPAALALLLMGCLVHDATQAHAH